MHVGNKTKAFKSKAVFSPLPAFFKPPSSLSPFKKSAFTLPLISKQTQENKTKKELEKIIVMMVWVKQNPS